MKPISSIRPIIKVCGMRDAHNIIQVEELRPDWMGFIFWPKSSRYVSTFPEYMPIYTKRVGVFVDEDIETVRQTAKDYALDIIQLHGHESPDYATRLREWEVIKAISVSNRSDIASCKAYEGTVDYFLFDTKCKTVGGSGEHFDWTVLNDYDGETPFLLSGGIGPDDVERVKAFCHPRCVGIDLNSRFETAPGLKDINKLKDFIKKIRL